MDRFLLDSMVWDELVKPERFGTVLTLCLENRVEFLRSHVEHDQLWAISDDEKKHKIFLIPFKLVATYGFVLDVSRIGLMRLSDGVAYNKMRGDSRTLETAKDALIANTAWYEKVPLVTNDERTKRFAAKKLPDLDLWPMEKFLNYIDQFGATPPVES